MEWENEVKTQGKHSGSSLSWSKTKVKEFQARTFVSES